MTTETFVETSVIVKLSNYIHPDDHIPLTYLFGMEITTGYENVTFDTRWETDKISFQRGIVLLSLIMGLVYRTVIENYVLLSIEIVSVCLCFLHKDLPGSVCSVATVNSREKDSQGPWKIAVAYRTSEKSPLATNLLEFEVTMDILNGKLNVF